jgi:AraC-like DNA-binding protein
VSIYPSRPSLGVLNLSEGEKKFRLSRYAVSEPLSFFIKHFWIVSWDLTGQEPYRQEVLPNPCVNMVIERGRSGIFGPSKSKFSYLIHGKGCVFGVKFHPGGFYPFTRQPVSELSTHPLDVSTLLGSDSCELEDAFLTLEDEGQMAELAESILKHKLPDRDDTVPLVNTIIGRIIQDRELTRVDAVCDYFNMNKRKLQRLFDQYVGVSPKWVIRLYRLQNAAEAMEKSGGTDLLKLSMELGYHDQAHFIKDFKAVVGETPEQYAR